MESIKVSPREVTVEVDHISGAVRCSYIADEDQGGGYYKESYYGYSKREAKAYFVASTKKAIAKEIGSWIVGVTA